VSYPGLDYAGYLGLCKGAKLDPRKPPDALPCVSTFQLGAWFKLFSFACRATLEGKR
jgi:hypothetical protein